MATVTFSIKIDADKKKLLESIAKSNYRSLSGEINMALDLYIKQVTTGGTFIQMPVSLPVVPAVQEQEVKEDVPMTLESFGDDEVDDL